MVTQRAIRKRKETVPSNIRTTTHANKQLIITNIYQFSTFCNSTLQATCIAVQRDESPSNFRTSQASALRRETATEPTECPVICSNNLTKSASARSRHAPPDSIAAFERRTTMNASCDWATRAAMQCSQPGRRSNDCPTPTSNNAAAAATADWFGVIFRPSAVSRRPAQTASARSQPHGPVRYLNNHH